MIGPSFSWLGYCLLHPNWQHLRRHPNKKPANTIRLCELQGIKDITITVSFQHEARTSTIDVGWEISRMFIQTGRGYAIQQEYVAKRGNTHGSDLLIMSCDVRMSLWNTALTCPGRTCLVYVRSSRDRLLSLLIQSLDLKWAIGAIRCAACSHQSLRFKNCCVQISSENMIGVDLWHSSTPMICLACTSLSQCTLQMLRLLPYSIPRATNWSRHSDATSLKTNAQVQPAAVLPDGGNHHF